jgi:hypothetical protein
MEDGRQDMACDLQVCTVCSLYYVSLSVNAARWSDWRETMSTVAEYLRRPVEDLF